MLSLFAVTEIVGKTIVKFPLSDEIKQEFTVYFQKQEEEFFCNVSDKHEFDGKYIPDYDELLYINNFSSKYEFESAIKEPLKISVIPSSPDAFSMIKALFVGYKDHSGESTILLQHFDKKKIISTRGFSLFHASNVYKKVDGVGITIEPKLTAILKGRKLFFSSFHFTRQIFELSEYYKEATAKDIEDFSKDKFVKVHDVEKLKIAADSIIRKKITSIRQSKVLESYPISSFKAAAAEIGMDFNTEIVDGVEVIILPEKRSELKALLKFLDEDYYMSQFSKKPYVTNSKRLLKRSKT